MAYNGSGVFARLYNWVNDAAAGVKIRADRMDAEMDGFATGLSSAILKDGTQTVTADIPFNSHKLTGVTDGTARTHAATVAQVQDSAPLWGGTSGGSANAQTITLAPAVTAQAAGRRISFVAGFTNTAAATLSPNGVAAAAFRKKLAGGLVALTGGEIVAGHVVTCVDTGTFYVIESLAEGTKGADIASVTPDLSAATGDYVDVTGTTAITGLGTAPAGVERTTRFTGILTLTHHATALILPGGSNITTAANDVAIWRSLGSGNWRCVAYTRANGEALVGGGMNIISIMALGGF